ncbi:rodlin [Streptomyces sp. NPDC000410]|uniref:rodlin n=1 Tax=Streptomyces sp. NPDC000410 TaxID=3154254 RepID=UPI003332CAF2
MIKKVMAAVAVTASAAGISVAAAPQALAIGDDTGPVSASGNGAAQFYGNQYTDGDYSPQMALIQGTLNKPCIGLPNKVNVGALGGILGTLAVQDINALSSAQSQQCTENSTAVDGDDPLSHVLEGLSLFSGNGETNG